MDLAAVFCAPTGRIVSFLQTSGTSRTVAEKLDAKTYIVKHLTNETETSWDDKGHTITIITPSSGPNSREDLFINHVHIHSKNWQWIHERQELVWVQGSGDSFLGGHVGFSDDALEGSGSLQFGANNKYESIRCYYLHPSYSCDLSTNAGAYIVKDGLILKWETTCDKWNNANWSENAMTFTYWIEKYGVVAGQQLYQTATVFSEAGGSIWNVEPRGPPGIGAATTNIDTSRVFTFEIDDGYTTPSTGTFPYMMAFQFDELAQSIVGGAMLTGEKSVNGDVIAMRGKLVNVFAVGKYRMVNESEDASVLTTHGRKLVVNGEQLKESVMSGNRLKWENLSTESATATGLPVSGYVEFSPDGNQVVGSSFGSQGFREYTTEEATSDLTFYMLLNMNPFGTDSKGNGVEVVQQNAMNDFYKIIQYYMPEKLLHDFIASEPPDLGELRDIAEDNKDNGPWYASLAVPYLATALKSANRDSVKKLNARRAQTYLKRATSMSQVYKEQAARLYVNEWVKMFPMMSKFIEDQKLNTDAQHHVINADADEWIAHLKGGFEHADKKEKEELQQMIDIAENSRDKGLNGLYWAYVFFRYLTSDGFLNMLRMLLIHGRSSSETVHKDIQRYCSVLSVLDPSTYFTKQFIHVIQIQQLTSVLPSMMDLRNNWDEVTFFMKMITEEFLKKHMNSPDPAIQKRVQEVEEELQKHSIQEYMKVLESVAVSSDAWKSYTTRFTNACVAKFGAIAKRVADLMLLSNVAYSVVLLLSGNIKWNELTPAEQVDFVTGCIKVVTIMIRKGITAIVAYEGTATWKLWAAIKVFFGGKLRVSQDMVTSALGKWVTRRSQKPLTALEEQALLDEEKAFKEEYPRIAKYLGVSMKEFMTRLAAVMSGLGILLSLFDLIDSSTPIDYAMNSMFLLSSVLDLTAILAEWKVEQGVTEIGYLSTAGIASLAGPLAIVAAIVGVILLIVELSTTKTPPNPVDEFVESDDVKKGGYYMKYETSIDYFQVINDKDGKPRDLGIAMLPAGNDLYLTANSDGSLSLGDLSYGYNTVLSVTTDHRGYSYFLTRIWQKKTSSDEYSVNVVALTLNDNNQLSMSGGVSDADKKTQQMWIVTCTGNVSYDKSSKDHLSSASFTIENVYRPGTYVTVANKSITSGTQPSNWTLSMKGMKPEFLTFDDIHIKTDDRDLDFSPYLVQNGSISGRSWSVSPALPNFLEFDTSHGVIKQKEGQAPPVYAKHDFTVKVTNEYGSASTGFAIDVKSGM